MKISNTQDQEFLKTLTVLYVEDDNDTRQQFSEFLRRPVGTLITAADGVEGLQAFKNHGPDIVVTDILMPRMDGLSMAHEILEITPSVPIIVVTAFEQTDYLMRAINSGIEKYVTKPVNSFLLFETLLECAHRLRAEQQLKLLHLQEIRDARSKNNETVATLAAGIAHDYNNMMQSILGYAALAKMLLEPGSEASNYLEKVERCSDEAAGLGEDGFGHADLADIVKESREVDAFADIVGEADFLGQGAREVRNALGVAAGVGVLGVQGAGQGVE